MFGDIPRALESPSGGCMVCYFHRAKYTHTYLLTKYPHVVWFLRWGHAHRRYAINVVDVALGHGADRWQMQ